jgi:hypothetical protein
VEISHEDNSWRISGKYNFLTMESFKFSILKALRKVKFNLNFPIKTLFEIPDKSSTRKTTLIRG